MVSLAKRLALVEESDAAKLNDELLDYQLSCLASFPVRQKLSLSGVTGLGRQQAQQKLPHGIMVKLIK